jgi:diguanylate cyclase (GGDEF)-like protein
MNIKKNVIFLCLFWLAAVSLSFALNYHGALEQQKQLALFTARSFFQQVVVTREWNARHGGVFVPVTAETQPNPYLDAPDRDLRVDSGRILTKINPAFMTRQLSEIAGESKGIQFRITSLKPIRPENRATELEAVYLRQFESGLAEGGGMVEKDGQAYYFYMVPLRTEKACLKCHAIQNYREGDIRGGISVTIPFKAEVPVKMMLLSHIGIALLGLFGIGIVSKKLDDSYSLIQQQAVMDALTGIPNRRSFSESILREFDRSRRGGEPLSLVMCDIDSFKIYNDTYGHSAGDVCLRKVAQGIKESLNRPGDICARYGGEEFVVILAGTNLGGAMKVAERIRQAIEAMQIRHDTSPASTVVTISLGVSTMKNNDVVSYEELIKRADEALYHAKRCGRNQVQYYQGG